MGVFNRLHRLGAPLMVCAATGFLWTKWTHDRDEHVNSASHQADLRCQAFKEKQSIPGVSVGVTLHGSMVWSKGFGLADIEQRVVCTPETVMRIASISKTFTITLAGQLVEKGKLDWDDPIAQHHPELPAFVYENEPMPITIRQLATHTSGVRHYWKKGEPVTDDEFILPEYYLTRSFPSITDALSLFVHDELLHRPGTSWMYTTHGYTLLSAILERAAADKQTFAELLQNLLVKQLDLQHTKLEYLDELVPHRSRYYCRRSLKQGIQNVAHVDLSYKWAGGGMLSNVNDLLIFANTLLQCRQTKSSDRQRLLQADTLRDMWSPIVATNRKNIFYGLGWMVANAQVSSVDELNVPAHVFHTGGAVGATSILLIIPCANQCPNPRCGVCVALLTNLQSANEIYRTALDIALLFRRMSPCSSRLTV